MKRRHFFILILSIYPFCSTPLFSQGIDFTYTTSYRIYNSNRAETREEYAGIWIPDMERDIRGLVMTTMVRNEFEFNNDTSVRRVCAEQDLALVFFYGEAQGDYYMGGTMGFHPRDGHDTVLHRVLQSFATLSGKPEIEHAPWLTFAHSAGITFCRNLAWWNPGRTFGVIHYKTGGISAPEWADPEATIIGIPWLAVSARIDKFEPVPEQGWKDSRAEVLSWRSKGHTISHIVEPTMEEGHSIWRPYTGAYIAEFIRHAAMSRIPSGKIAREAPVELVRLKESWGTLTTSDTEALMDQEELPGDLVWYYQDADPFYHSSRFWHINAQMATCWINYEHRDFDPFRPEGDTVLRGSVKTWNNALPLGHGAMERISGAVVLDHGADSSRTGAAAPVGPDGGFTAVSRFPLVGVEIRLKKDTSHPGIHPVQEFINGADAFLAHRIASGDPSFRPDVFQISAADANMDGVVDPSDVERILERAVLKLDSFPRDFVFIDSAWNRFNPKTRISAGYPEDDGKGFSRSRLPGLGSLVTVGYSPGRPWPFYKKTTIYGIALGDVDGSLDRQGLAPSETDSMVVGMPVHSEEGDTVWLPVSISRHLNASSLDLRFVNSDIVPLKGGYGWFDLAEVKTPPGSHAAFRTIDSLAMISLFHPGGMPETGPVIRLGFIPRSKGGAIPYLTDMKGWADGNPLAVYAGNLSGTRTGAGSGRKIMLYPNPVSDRLRIWIGEPVTGKLSFAIVDLTGRVQLRSESKKNYAEQEFTLLTGNLESGAYYLRIGWKNGSVVRPFLKK